MHDRIDVANMNDMSPPQQRQEVLGEKTNNIHLYHCG
jgi:hypothetical protein